MSKPISVDDGTSVAMPIRNMLAIIGAVAVGVWSYFGIVERLNISETKLTLLQKDLNQAIEMLSTDLEKNTEFRIKWPRGEMGSLPADSEQFLLIENMVVELEKLTERVDNMMHNKVNIERLIKDVDKLSEQLEVVKDKVRKNGSH